MPEKVYDDIKERAAQNLTEKLGADAAQVIGKQNRGSFRCWYQPCRSSDLQPTEQCEDSIFQTCIQISRNNQYNGVTNPDLSQTCNLSAYKGADLKTGNDGAGGGVAGTKPGVGGDASGGGASGGGSSGGGSSGGGTSGGGSSGGGASGGGTSGEKTSNTQNANAKTSNDSQGSTHVSAKANVRSVLVEDVPPVQKNHSNQKFQISVRRASK